MIWPAETIWQQVMALGLPSLAGFSVEILPQIDSTNSELMRRARAGRLEPVLLVAEQQSAGRGRMGRAWESSAGHALTFSLGLSLSPPSWEGLSLAVGVSIASCFDLDGQSSLQIKWPNDLWWQQRKLAGILIETLAPHAGPARFVVIGVGINVRPQPFEQALRTRPACLEDLDAAYTPALALERLCLPLLSDILAFERSGFAPFVQRYAARDALAGANVWLSDGRQGRAQGVDDRGAMLVHTSQGLQRVTSQELSVRPVSDSLHP